jgi:hypothetical protein
MKEEELRKKLEKVELPHIELESHRSRLKMALLNSDYFKKKGRNTLMDAVRTQARGMIDTMLGGTIGRRPTWKVALVTSFAILMMAGMVFGLGSLNGTEQAGLNPNGSTVIGGEQLTDAEKALAMDILKADPGVQALLAGGATIDMVLPVLIELEKINPETGAIEYVQETWGQAWISEIDGSTWGALVDLVQGKVVQLSD